MLYEVITQHGQGEAGQEELELEEALIEAAAPGQTPGEAEDDAERARTLFEGGAISRQALDRAQTVITSYSIHYTKLYEPCS